jgi:hypothetical protein
MEMLAVEQCENITFCFAFSTLALDRDEWYASLPGYLTPKEAAAGTHCTGGCLCHKATLDTVALPYQRLEPDSFVVQPIAHCYLDGAIL